jgi:AraC family transcriptional regulator
MNPTWNQSLPLQLQKKAVWDGISLAHYWLRPGHLPEHKQNAHLIISALDECKAQIRTANGFRTHDRTPGSVCVIPSDHPFAVDAEGDSEHLALLLDPALVERAASAFRAPAHVEILESSAPGDPVINSIALALDAEVETGNQGGLLHAESLANILALHLVRHYSSSKDLRLPHIGGLSGKKLRGVLDFINENYARDLSLAELAAVGGMSTFHFAREFKRATGETPHQYLIKTRVDRAKELLSRSELPLVEVGFQSGFSHQSHFTRLFRKSTGTTPHSYRLRFQT